MNEQQRAIWGKDFVLLAYPDPGKYEEDNYRHGQTEEIQPATHTCSRGGYILLHSIIAEKHSA
jgi:hypothetical protein